MGLVNLNVFPRTTQGKNENRRTRAAGRIPAVLYGRDRESAKVEVDAHEFWVIHTKTGGRSVIFNLQGEGFDADSIALLREVQQHPVSDEILHVDLFEIPRGVPVEVEVPVVLEGEPELVRLNEADLIQTLYQVTVSCRPRQVPDRLTLDVSPLGMNESLYVKDLAIESGEIVTDDEIQVCVVKPASIFLEEEEEEAEGELAEGEEAPEGEASAEGESEEE